MGSADSCNLLLRAHITKSVRVLAGIAGVLAVLHLVFFVLVFLTVSFWSDLAGFNPGGKVFLVTLLLVMLLLAVLGFALALRAHWGLVGLLVSVGSLLVAAAVFALFGIPHMWFFACDSVILAAPPLVTAFWPRKTASSSGRT